jgi:MoxR-like ATPase
MDEGMPIILDELDMAAVGGLGRLHQIMQLHPGDSVLIQEDTGKVITIKEGFVIMATANLASSRYELNRLDPALYQRFQRGAGVHPVPYPDHLIDVGGYPKENMELAIAQLTRKDGSAEIPAGFAPAGSSADRLKVFYKFVQAAQHTQRLFTEPVSDADSVGKSIVSSSEYQSRKPVLKESVISPRIVLAVIERLQQNPNLELTEMLAQQVSGYASDSDRIIIAKILASYGLLEGVSERELRVPTGSLEGLQAAA